MPNVYIRREREIVISIKLVFLKMMANGVIYMPEKSTTFRRLFDMSLDSSETAGKLCVNWDFKLAAKRQRPGS